MTHSEAMGIANLDVISALGTDGVNQMGFAPRDSLASASKEGLVSVSAAGRMRPRASDNQRGVSCRTLYRTHTI